MLLYWFRRKLWRTITTTTTTIIIIIIIIIITIIIIIIIIKLQFYCKFEIFTFNLKYYLLPLRSKSTRKIDRGFHFRAIKTAKYPHYRPWRRTGDADATVHTYTAKTLGRGRLGSPTLGRLYPRGKTTVLIFIGGWMDPRTSLDTKAWRKISTPSTPGIEPGLPVRSQAPCRLSYLAHQ